MAGPEGAPIAGNLRRVLLVAPLPPERGGTSPGGVATHSAHLAEGLAADGLDVTVLATNVPAPSPLTASEQRGGVRIVPLYLPVKTADWLAPPYLRAVGLARALGYAARLARHSLPKAAGARQVALGHTLWYARTIARVRPEVLHVQHPLDRHLYARLLLGWEGWRLPLVVTLHSFFAEHPDSVIQGLMRPNLAHADRFIAVSRDTARQAESLGADPRKIHVIRSGVDAERFRPRDPAAARRRLDIPQDARVVLFVGNLEPRKAVDVLLQATARLRTERGDGPLLAIVGTGASAGADDQEPRLRALGAALHLESSTRFVGRVSDDVLLDWYAAADVFALPSRSEAQGIAALEAMSSGLPVVASAVGGLLETIEDGHTGLLVPPGDEQALAAALGRLLADPGFGQQVGAAGRAAVVREFSWPASVRATCAVYEEAFRSRLQETPR